MTEDSKRELRRSGGLAIANDEVSAPEEVSGWGRLEANSTREGDSKDGWGRPIKKVIYEDTKREAETLLAHLGKIEDAFL